MLVWLRKRWVYHALAWTIAFGTFVFLEWDRGRSASFLDCLVDSSLSLVIPLVLIYTHLWGKDYFLSRGAYRSYACWFLGVFLAGLLAYKLEVSDGNSFWQDVVNVGFFLVASTGIQYFKRGLVEQYQQQEVKARSVETELHALRAQLNPHFLFNTLNNIHGVNLHDAARGSEMIIELSAVMRYHLEHSRRNRVSLEDEVELLEGYIKLEQLRLGENCDLCIQLPTDQPEVFLSPLLLLPLVENAFKHGTHSTRACHVNIKLEAGPGELCLKVVNSKIEQPGLRGTGVGLANLKRRLALIYPDQHSLQLEEKGKTFQAVLTLGL